MTDRLDDADPPAGEGDEPTFEIDDLEVSDAEAERLTGGEKSCGADGKSCSGKLHI